MNDQCPKQGMYFRIFFFVLNRVRVSNPQRLTYTQILVEYPPPPPGKALLSITQIALSLSLTLTRNLGGNTFLHLHKSQLKFLLNKRLWKSLSLRFLGEKLWVAWVRIGCERTGYLLAPYWKKSNCSSLKIFRIKLTVPIYGGKVTSNSIERLRPVTYNTTLSISFPQNVRLRPYPCSLATGERARRRQSPSHSHLRAFLAWFLKAPPNGEPAWIAGYKNVFWTYLSSVLSLQNSVFRLLEFMFFVLTS